MAKQAAIEPKQSDKKEWALLIRQTKFTELKKNALTQKSYPLVGDSTLLKIPRLECAPVWLIF